MEEGSVANLRTVERALKVALTFARPMVVERGATGAGENVRNLLEGRAGYALPTVVWFKGRRQTKEV